jgi:hypothetical protein
MHNFPGKSDSWERMMCYRIAFEFKLPSCENYASVETLSIVILFSIFTKDCMVGPQVRNFQTRYTLYYATYFISTMIKSICSTNQEDLSFPMQTT